MLSSTGKYYKALFVMDECEVDDTLLLLLSTRRPTCTSAYRPYTKEKEEKAKCMDRSDGT